MKKLTKEKLQELENLYTAPPSSQVWANIQSELSEELKPKKSLFVLFKKHVGWTKLVLAASILLFLTLGIRLQFDPYQPIESNQADIATSEIKLNVPQDSKPSVKESTDDKIGDSKNLETVEKVITQNKRSNRKRLKKEEKVNSTNTILASNSPVETLSKESVSAQQMELASSNSKKQVLVSLPSVEVQNIEVKSPSIAHEVKNRTMASTNVKPEMDKLINDKNIMGQIRENTIAFLSNKVSELGQELNIRNTRRIKSIEIIY